MSTHLGMDTHNIDKALYDLLINDELAVEQVIRREVRPNLALLPAKVDLYLADMELPSIDRREYRLRRALEPVKPEFDFILIDCPSWLGLLTINALSASDGVILPLECEYFALEGMQMLLKTIKLVRDRLNPKFELFGMSSPYMILARG